MHGSVEKVKFNFATFSESKMSRVMWQLWVRRWGGCGAFLLVLWSRDMLYSHVTITPWHDSLRGSWLRPTWCAQILCIAAHGSNFKVTVRSHRTVHLLGVWIEISAFWGSESLQTTPNTPYTTHFYPTSFGCHFIFCQSSKCPYAKLSSRTKFMTSSPEKMATF